VPFYIRVGKRMASTITEIYVKYKPSVWAAIMQDKDPGCSDYLRLRLSPNVEIALGTRVKRSGNEYRGECIELLAKHDRPDQMLPYERLFRDALVGNTELFSRGDMTIAQWRVVENVLGDRAPLYSYSQGSWGPEAANQLLREGRWYTPGSAGPGECVTCTLNGSATTTKR
jgi:glucose-6-phosphate 1-dehydrogenase